MLGTLAKHSFVGDSNSWIDVLGLHKNENISTGDWVLYAVLALKRGRSQKRE